MKLQKRFGSLAVALTMAVVCNVAGAEIVFVDFGDSTRTTDLSTWNNVSGTNDQPLATGVAVSNAVDSSGATTGCGVQSYSLGIISSGIWTPMASPMARSCPSAERVTVTTTLRPLISWTRPRSSSGVPIGVGRR